MDKANRNSKLRLIPVCIQGIPREEAHDKVEGRRASYAEIVKNHQYSQGPLSDKNEQKNHRSSSISILLHNIPQEASAKEIWQFFNKGRFIQDIILPGKKDKNNYRIGFAIVSYSALEKFD